LKKSGFFYLGIAEFFAKHETLHATLEQLAKIVGGFAGIGRFPAVF
jgi:hypothetical protein